MERTNIKLSIDQISDDLRLNKTFLKTVAWLDHHSYQGACHNVSAALHILLTEQGVENTLIFGQVCVANTRFDHSWVEIDGYVYDPTISFQPSFRKFEIPPIFSSLGTDLSEHQSLLYGPATDPGEVEKMIIEMTLSEYNKYQSKNNSESSKSLSELTEILCREVGLSEIEVNLVEKFGDRERTLRKSVEKVELPCMASA